MKKIWTVIIIAIICAITAVTVYSTPADLLSNLSLYLPFNANVTDGSGNSNVVTNYGATLIEDRNGASNSAYSFDGVDDYMTVQNSSSINMGTSDFTISFWVKPTYVASGTQTIFDKRMNTPRWGGYLVYLNQANYVCMQLAGPYLRNGILYYGYSNYYSTTPLLYNTWQLVTITISRNSTSGMSFYCNASLINSTDPTGYTLSIDSTVNAVIGGISCGTYISLKSSIDDLRIYKRVLTQTEITALYNTTNPDPIDYVGTVGINDLEDTGTDPEVAFLSKDSRGVVVSINDSVTSNSVRTITGFFNASTDWLPLSITTINLNSSQGIVITAKNEITDEIKSQTYNLSSSTITGTITLPLYYVH